MPIHDQGYRRYHGTRMPRGRAWSVITVAGLRTFFGKRAFLALLLLSWIPFVFRALQIYAAANVSHIDLLKGEVQRLLDGQARLAQLSAEAALDAKQRIEEATSALKEGGSAAGDRGRQSRSAA